MRIQTKLLLIAAFAVPWLSCTRSSTTDSEEPADCQSIPQENVIWGGLAPSPWPMYLHDPQHTVRSAISGPDSAEIVWQVTLLPEIHASPVIGADGTVYIGTSGNAMSLFAISPDGAIMWEYKAEGQIASSALIAADGTIYVGADDGYLHALWPDGSRKWRFQTNGVFFLSSPVISRDGTIIFAQVDIGHVGGKPVGEDGLFAVRQDGTLLWHFAPDSSQGRLINFSPALSPDGSTLYAPGWQALFAVDAATGALRWALATDGQMATPSLDNAGNIYFLTTKSIYSVAPDGNVRWQRSIQGGNVLYSSVSIDRQGALLFYNGRNLTAFDMAGTACWDYDFSEYKNYFYSEIPVLVDARRRIYSGTGVFDNSITAANFFIFEPDGQMRHAINFSSATMPSPGISSVPAIDAQNRLIVALENGVVLCAK